MNLKSITQNLSKVLRYIKMYGFSRTIIKIQGKLHIEKNEIITTEKWNNSKIKNLDTLNKHVAIIGCGYFAFSVISFYLYKKNKNFLQATFDINPTRAKSLCKKYNGAYSTIHIEDILSDEKIKLVYISTNHSSHATYAEMCIKAGKNVHIEKPHVVSYSQLDRLNTVLENFNKIKIFLGFNRPKSLLFKKLLNSINEQSGSLMINWFIVGHFLEDSHWYNDPKEGGRILGNLSHWTDLTLHLVGLKNAFPCEIIPTKSPNSLSDFIVSIKFAEGSSAVISFSAKGYISEGVYEVLNLQKGDLVANLTNFDKLSLNNKDYNKTIKPFFRDHGHRNNIINSYTLSNDINKNGESVEYINKTALLFLGIKESMEKNETVFINV
jgi:predicted dehydrogenase